MLPVTETHPIERASVEQADVDLAKRIVREWRPNGYPAKEAEIARSLSTHRQQARDAGFAEGREALMTTTSHLVAAISLLRKYHDACAPTKRHALFGTMIADYEKAAETGRAAISAEANEGRCDAEGGSL